MFIVSLDYICDIADIERHLEAHLAYLDRYYAAGTFIASGRKLPRTGGVIFALAESREALERVLAEDPFQVHHLAQYDITEFVPTKTAAALSFLQP